MFLYLPRPRGPQLNLVCWPLVPSDCCLWSSNCHCRLRTIPRWCAAEVSLPVGVICGGIGHDACLDNRYRSFRTITSANYGRRQNRSLSVPQAAMSLLFQQLGRSSVLLRSETSATTLFVRGAKKKAGGSTTNGRGSAGRRLVCMLSLIHI